MYPKEKINKIGFLFVIDMAVNQEQMKKCFLGIIMIFSVVLARAQDKILSMDCMSAESYLNYLPNDLVVFKPLETKSDHSGDTLISHLHLVENEYTPDVKLASYLESEDDSLMSEAYSAVWKVYFTNSEKGCQVDMHLMQVWDAMEDTLDIEKFKSSGKLEEEVFHYLSVSDDHDYYHETWGAIEALEEDSIVSDIRVLENPIADLLNEECFIPMDIDMGAVYALLGEMNSEFACDDCELTEGVGWNFEEHTKFFIYSFPKNERIYYLSNSAPNEVIDLALFDFSIGLTDKTEILEKYELDEEALETIQPVENGYFDILYDSEREYIPLNLHDLFVKLEFENEVLRGILYSAKEF